MCAFMLRQQPEQAVRTVVATIDKAYGPSKWDTPRAIVVVSGTFMYTIIYIRLLHTSVFVLLVFWGVCVRLCVCITIYVCLMSRMNVIVLYIMELFAETG